MRSIAGVAWIGMLVAACTADPLGGEGADEAPGGGASGETIAAKPSGTPQDIVISGSGLSGQVFGCSAPAACLWRFTGTASGTPLDGTATIVVEIETTGSWDAGGCQQFVDGTVRFFRRANQQGSVGWMFVLTGTYCTGTGGHSGTGNFTVLPDAPPGKHKNVVGSGIFTFTDAVGNDPGDTGPWDMDLAGNITF